MIKDGQKQKIISLLLGLTLSADNLQFDGQVFDCSSG